MADPRYNQVVTDDQVRAIMLAPPEISHVELAKQLGVKVWAVKGYRLRQGKRAMRIARELGLPPLIDPRPYIVSDDERRAYVVKGVRG